MARSGRAANIALLAVAAVVGAALVAYPVVGAISWRLAEPSEQTVVVYNTTVPDEERLQQRAVDLVLEYRKLTRVRFVGAAPGGIDIGAWPTEPPDIVFLVDAYGVYLEDLPGIGRANVGLLTQPLGDPVAPDLETWLEQGTFVYGEFNILHAPTPPDISERFQDLFGVDATGWVGRWYDDLSDAGTAIRQLHDGPWPEGEEGLVLVSDSVGTTQRVPELVLLTGADVSGGPPTISGRSFDGRELVRVPMLDWFSLITPADSADVLMWLDLPITGSTADALEARGIPSRTPLLVATERSAYFAANMSRTSAEFPMRAISGSLEVLRSLPQSDDAASFYRVTAPTLTWIIDQN